MCYIIYFRDPQYGHLWLSRYKMTSKYGSFSPENLLYKMGHYFLDRWYIYDCKCICDFLIDRHRVGNLLIILS